MRVGDVDRAGVTVFDLCEPTIFMPLTVREILHKVAVAFVTWLALDLTRAEWVPSVLEIPRRQTKSGVTSQEPVPSGKKVQKARPRERDLDSPSTPPEQHCSRGLSFRALTICRSFLL
jgi:hypothetical protein